MIGNDIIDLSLARTQSNWQRSGFLEKQFTKDEIELIRKSKTPFLSVWRLWSMKEATYKVVVQQQSKRFFAPKKFECLTTAEAYGFVKFEDKIFKSTTETTSKYIYTFVGESTSRYIGLKINRQEILQIIERQTGIESTQLEIKKNDFGVPNLFAGGEQISTSFTKTHHGRFQAFQYRLH